MKSFNPRARVGRDLACKYRSCSTQVSIHAPAWGATSVAFLLMWQQYVSIHAPAWGATGDRELINSCEKFQSTRPRGARRTEARNFARCRGFNPRARVGRDQTADRTRPVERSFQSTRPRGARRITFSILLCNVEVSIHAPAWGATFVKGTTDRECEFQSTRPRGARLIVQSSGGFI